MSPVPIARRVGLVFSGGPAPAANAVVSACALQFLDAGIEVVGLLDGYSHLMRHVPGTPLVEGREYLNLGVEDVSGIRNRKSIILRTSHANPSAGIFGDDDLIDPTKNGTIAAIYSALEELEIDALVSIGGDETLRTANHLHRFQTLVPGRRPLCVVHLPKTIDNDYYGIDWTFGFVSAVDFAAREIRNLGADAQTTCTWYVLEMMGRQAGWLTYAAGIAGEATRMISVEDVGERFDLDASADDIAGLMLEREAGGKRYGIVCVAEGLAARLGEGGVDARGYSVLGNVRVGERFATAVEDAYRRRCGREVRVRSKQIGYEARCAEPVAFDILLGSQLGVGAYRAVVEQRGGTMVSVRDQLEIVHVPFEDLVDPATLRTRVRYVEPSSDFYKLARALEYHGEKEPRDIS
jgi:6-phosphofructokinase